MKTNSSIKFSPKIITVPLLFILIIWLVYWIEIHFGINFTTYGILPRKLNGLKGVLFSPFIHSDTKHLFNNTIPLFVLFSSLIYFYNKVFLKILVFGTVLSGLLTWCIAREAYHIGASGVVYLLFSFVFFSGIIKRQFQLVAVSLIVIFLYGSMIWYMLPIKNGISWEGHLSGFLIGLFFAILYRHKGIVKEKYEFTQTEFDFLFDENGNIIIPEEESSEEISEFN